MASALTERGSGVLLHLTSLPSRFGIGDLGPAGRNFIDWLEGGRQTYWQILPLNPTRPEHGNSPYYSFSAWAGNPLLISPEELAGQGLLTEADLSAQPEPPPGPVSFEDVTAGKAGLLDRAFYRFQERGDETAFKRFCEDNSAWLNDFALFSVLKDRFRDQAWSRWPAALRDRNKEALEAAWREEKKAVEKVCWLQYVFFDQWLALKDYGRSKGVKVIGDAPIYVTHDSVDVWAHPHLFQLDPKGRPLVVAGVPPDYFSQTGQRWGHPIYSWPALQEQGYAWWLDRLDHNLKLFDLLRIDHFRGLVGYWEIPAQEQTAVKGRWVEAPAADFLSAVAERFPEAPLIAEDLGVITPDVTEIRRRFGLPGMALLLFAFGPDLPTNPYAPHNIEPDTVVYTGTHDNNTAQGWFEEEASPEEKSRLLSYLGREVDQAEIHWELIRLAMMSVARTAILPMQDLLGLGQEARMNRPAKRKGNWRWRLKAEELSPVLADRLAEMTKIYGRTGRLF